MTEPPQLLTPRLRLRRWEPGDLQAMNRIYQQPEVVRTLVPMSLDDTRAQIERFTRLWIENGFGIWAAEDRATDRLIGRIGLMRHEDWPGGDEIEVGWTLDAAYHGRGLATEGGRISLEWGFEHLSVDRIISITRPDNLASRRVMEKLGLTYRGERDWRGIHHVWYAIDREDWKAAATSR